MMKHVELRKEMMGALIALAKTSNNNPKTENTDRVLIEGLVAVRTESFGEEMLQKKLDATRQEKYAISPNCSICVAPCGNTSEYNLDMWKEEEEVCQEIKRQMLKMLLDMAQMVYQGMMLKKDMSESMNIFYKVLEILSYSFEEVDLLEYKAEIEENRSIIQECLK